MASRRHHSQAVVVLAVTLTLSLAVAAEAVEFAGGTGEPNDPYQIATAEQLTSIGSDWNLLDKHYVLVADIDLDPHLPGGRIFAGAPISPAHIRCAHVCYVDSDPFTGSFDGKGQTIRNLTIRAADEVDAYVGLFGRVQGRVQNVRLADVDIAGGTQVGGLAGRNQGTIVGCSVTGRVAGQYAVGAVAGWNEGLVSCCHAAGEVSGGNTAGGLVGLHSSGAVAFSYSAVQVNGDQDVGGLIGASGEGSVYLSYWDLDVSGVLLSGGGRGKHTSQMFQRDLYRGWGYPGRWTLADGADYPRLSWEAPDGQPIVDIPYAYGGGTGEPNTPFEIWSAEQLLSLGYRPADFNDRFILMADIDLGDIDPNLFVPIGTTHWPFAGIFDGNGHIISNLVCVLAGQSCVGLFGYVEPHYFRSARYPYSRYAPGVVTNLHLADVLVRGANCTGALVGMNRGSISACMATGKVSGSDHTGGLVGDSKTHIRECRFSGDVEGKDATGGLCGYTRYPAGIFYCSATGSVRGVSRVGGLVGDADLGGPDSVVSCDAQCQVTGTDAVGGLAGSNYGRVRDSYSVSSVVGQTQVGGLAGRNWGDIERCTCSGEVLGDNRVGGLIGYNDDTITSSYATARVTGHSAVGGLIGYNSEGTAMYSYAAGVVSGDGNDVGGLVGCDSGGQFLLCYWDTDASGLTSSQGGFGRPTRQMRQARTFCGWRAGDWTIREGVDYPRLVWEQTGGQFLTCDAPPYGAGTGDPNDPYQVWTPQQFVAIAHQPADYAKCFALMADIDMAEIDASEMIPIGSGAAPFLGRFDGKGHAISNFRCASPGSPYTGVFGVLGWIGYSWRKPADTIGIITDLHLANVDISGGSRTGGLVGAVAEGQIVDSSVTGRVEGLDCTGGLAGSISGDLRGISCDVTVRGGKRVGGLAGYCAGTIADSSSQGAVSGHDEVGGLAGDHSGVLSSCSSTCAVTASGSSVGGLAGACGGPVTDCHATGDVAGYQYVGGLIGFDGGDLRGCYATGQVVADCNAAGGLVGDCGWGGANLVITACWATGTVRGRDQVGGLIGSSYALTVDQCFSRSDVVGRDRVGGLIGTSRGSLRSSYTRGSVTGRDYVGGLIGYNWRPVADCYSTGRVSGAGRRPDLYTGGLFGYPTSREIEACFWDVETSGITDNAELRRGTGKTTAQMQTAATFTSAGWDFVGETANGTDDIWTICEGRDYPRLRWEQVECGE
jgi:hypothetical protein